MEKMIKIDEKRQELILSNGRRVDMHYVDDFLIEYTNRDIDAYIRSKSLSKDVERINDVDECQLLLDLHLDDFDNDKSLKERVQKLLDNLQEMKREFRSVQNLKDIKERHDEFKDKMREFLIDWGSYLKNIQSSLSFSESEVNQIDQISSAFFDFDFDNE